MTDDRIVALLAEMREAQREQIALSRRAVEHAEMQARLAMDAAERSIANQQQAIATQQGGMKIYKRVVGVVLVLVALLVALLLKIMLPYWFGYR